MLTIPQLSILCIAALCFLSNGETYSDKSEWQQAAVPLLKRCDSIVSTYGDYNAYRVKKKQIMDYECTKYSVEEINRARNAMNSFHSLHKELSRFKKLKPGPADPQRSDGDYYIDPVYACSTLAGDSTLAAIQCRDYVVSRCAAITVDYYIWLNTCRAADVLEMTTSLQGKSTIPPSDTIYTSLKKRIREVLDSFPRLYNHSTDIDPYSSKPNYYPQDELKKVVWAVDTAAGLVPRLNKLLKNRKYNDIVAVLRGMDTCKYDHVMFHRAAFLFYNYSIIDSLILDNYEVVLQEKAGSRKVAALDSLIRKLENDTHFLFPHKIAQRKRRIIAAFSSLKTKPPTGGIASGTAHEKLTGAPIFRCLYSGSIAADMDITCMSAKKWFYLAPKLNNVAREYVFEGTLSSLGLSITGGKENHATNTVINVVDDQNPVLLLCNFWGVTTGAVEKAEVYDMGGRCLAVIENDSCEFSFDVGNHPRFIGATVQDSIYFGGECGHYIAWIGDVNRNGKIEFIIEHSAPQMQTTVQFIEKHDKNGRSVFETVSVYTEISSQTDME